MESNHWESIESSYNKILETPDDGSAFDRPNTTKMKAKRRRSIKDSDFAVLLRTAVRNDVSISFAPSDL